MRSFSSRVICSVTGSVHLGRGGEIKIQVEIISPSNDFKY